MTADPNKKTPRTFQCRDTLWLKFEQMARELECSVDYLINDAMKQYARQRGYTSTSAASPIPTGALPPTAPGGGKRPSAPPPPPQPGRPLAPPPPAGPSLPPLPVGARARAAATAAGWGPRTRPHRRRFPSLPPRRLDRGSRPLLPQPVG